MDSPTSPSPDTQIVIVIGAHPNDAELVAQSFAAHGDSIRVIWFEHAREAIAAGLQKILAGIVVCQDDNQIPSEDLLTLRRALPDTPVLPWEHRHAA